MKNFKKGFTLIELLVVISIIGILASLLLANYTRVQRQANDTQRKSDLNQYRIALENFAVKTGGLYPALASGSTIDADEICTAALTSYMSSCLKDPLDQGLEENRRYIYRGSVGVLGQPTSLKYSLYVHAGLEAEPTKTWVVCWDGKAATVENSMSAVDTFCPI